MKSHHYKMNLHWRGNQGLGTQDYKSYSRNYTVQVTGKPEFWGSSDPSFRGDPRHYNPEELLVASLSGCHMLWYLHLCAEAGVVVHTYTDAAEGCMVEQPDGSGRFTEVVLRPQVGVAEASMIPLALSLHEQAHKMCFIAKSCNFPVLHEPVCGLGVLK